MIHIAAVQRGEVVSKKLQGHNFKDGQKQFRCGGNVNDPVRKRHDCPVLLGRNGD